VEIRFLKGNELLTLTVFEKVLINVSFAHPYLSLLEFGLKVTKKHREETI
jgi:hypothetical protein